jgi:hypothetical protein
MRRNVFAAHSMQQHEKRHVAERLSIRAWKANPADGLSCFAGYQSRDRKAERGVCAQYFSGPRL